ncbi:putative neutral sphingomyelinase [Orchesella cincta]|uniref:sphingomyelin phosphodiesterase n=1 Tax=Orchesella cincta TaxID=48709 RepID=A0A1D2N153_ORCCI|nr:putative neutral sphingomyelinase [Orchesella cincta]
METELTVVTLNCWGILLVSRNRVARMTAIAEELASGKYDFVFLQEVWTTEDYERIKLRTTAVLPYSHYFFSGVVGAGLCIFSRSPIKTTFFHQWAVNGYIHKVQHGDWFGGKGIGMVEVEHEGLTINLYSAHLHAEYDRKNDEYLAHRVNQAFDFAQFISLTSRHADVVIVGGDLNTEPGDLAYRLIVHTAHLHDAALVCSSTSEELRSMNTCKTERNSYSSLSSLKTNPFGKRIDYVAFKGGPTVNVFALRCETSWPDRVPGQTFSYSDHEAVVAKLRVSKFVMGSILIAPAVLEEERKNEILEESIEVCDHALTHLEASKKMYILLSIAMFMLLTITANLEFPLAPVLRVVLLFLLFFAVFMSVIWHRMEVHGILSGKLGMVIELGRPITPKEDKLPETTGMGGSGDDAWTEVCSTGCIP